MVTWKEQSKDIIGKWAKTISADMSVRDIARQTGLSRHTSKLLQRSLSSLKTQSTDTPKAVADTVETDDNYLHNDNYYYNDQTDTYVTFIKSAPKPMVVPGHVHRSMKQSYSNWDGEPSSINEICRKFKIPRSWFTEYKQVHGWTHDSEPFSSEEIMTRDIEALTEDALQSRRQALYQRYEIKKWQEIKSDAEKWNNFDVEVLGKLTESISKEYTPATVKVKATKNNQVLVMGLTDFHWGMYAWAGETHTPYDRQKAKEALFNASVKILSRLPESPDEIILPIGSDFFDIDGNHPKTTKGTLVENDGTPSQILVTGCELMREYVDYLRLYAPVRLVLMSGNHDRSNGLALLLYLSAWYRNDSLVTVVQSYTPRNYVEYGENLIAFSHGDGSSTKPSDLVGIVATEAREAWGRTKHHIAFGGHLHHTHVRDFTGLTHYQMPALAGVNRWAMENGFISTPKMSSYLIDKVEGVVAVYTGSPS